MEIRLSLHNVVYPRSPVFCGYKIGNKEFHFFYRTHF